MRISPTQENNNRTKHNMVPFFLIVFGFISKLAISSDDLFSDSIMYTGDFLFLCGVISTFFFYKVKPEVNNMVFFTLLLFISSLFSTYWYDRSISGSATSLLRMLLPIFVSISLMTITFETKQYRALRNLGVMTLLLIHLFLIYGFLFLPPSTNRLEVWAPAYFRGLHSTAYVVIASYFLFYILFVNNHKKRWLWDLFYLGLTFFYIVVLFGVRTALVTLIVFTMLRIGTHFKIPRIPVLFYGIATILFLFIALDPFGAKSEEVSHLTSGRTKMYADKVEQLLSNDAVGWIFGNGFGSDLIETDVWWWDVKGAHNDFITLLVENGFLGILVLGLIFTIYIQFVLKCVPGSMVLKFMFIAFFIPSVGSNGILVRPIASYVFFLCIALAFSSGVSITQFQQESNQ